MGYWDDVVNNRKTLRTTSNPDTGNITKSTKRQPAPWSGYKRVAETYTKPGLSVDNPVAHLPEWSKSIRQSQSARMNPTTSYSSGGGGGGGGYFRYGGGGGGGGGPVGLTEEQLAAYKRLLGQGPSLVNFQKFRPGKDLRMPAYQEFEPGELMEYEAFTPDPRSTAVYDFARTSLGKARQADASEARRLYNALDATLAEQSNVFDDAYTAVTPEMAQQYQAIVGGPEANAMVGDVVGEMNAGAAAQDDALSRMMTLLRAQEERNMQSRVREAEQARLGTLNAINAQATGLLGGIEMANIRDAEEYRRYLQDIAFQENRYGQEWARANQDYLNQIALMNHQGGQEWARSDVDWAREQALANYAAMMQNRGTNATIENQWLGQLLGLIPSLSGEALTPIGA